MKEKINIQGFEIHCSTTDMNIIDSYKVNNITMMKTILIEALDTTSLYKTNRTMKSLLNEWISHNFLYQHNLYVEHTKDCNFESEQTTEYKIKYYLVSKIAKIINFIKGGFKDNGTK